MTKTANNIDLKGLSAIELRKLADKANRLANDLEKEQPSYSLALENGIEDLSYDTTANGLVSCYSGEAIIEMADGSVWKAIGHGPKGDAWSIHRDGYIEFVKFNPKEELK